MYLLYSDHLFSFMEISRTASIFYYQTWFIWVWYLLYYLLFKIYGFSTFIHVCSDLFFNAPLPHQRKILVLYRWFIFFIYRHILNKFLHKLHYPAFIVSSVWVYTARSAFRGLIFCQINGCRSFQHARNCSYCTCYQTF